MIYESLHSFYTDIECWNKFETVTTFNFGLIIFKSWTLNYYHIEFLTSCLVSKLSSWYIPNITNYEIILIHNFIIAQGTRIPLPPKIKIFAWYPRMTVFNKHNSIGLWIIMAHEQLPMCALVLTNIYKSLRNQKHIFAFRN